jgi:Na+-transporting NADH:ubiquinone oxidoreductase subunit NqrF
VREQLLQDHLQIQTVEFYLCGPPQMIKACHKMLAELRVSLSQISSDEF